MNGFSIYGLWKKNQRVTPLFFLCLCASLFFSRTAGASETGWSWLGVETKPITKQVARQMDLPGGALITKVHLDGPSNEYLIPGDLIVSVNGNPTQQPDDLLRMLAPVTPGVQVEIGFMRQKTGRQPKSVPIVLAEMPGKALGLFLASNEEVGNRRRAREVENGVPILEVDPGSEAANQGLAPGDVITAIGSTPVTTRAELQRKIQESRQNRGTVVLDISKPKTGIGSVALRALPVPKSTDVAEPADFAAMELLYAQLRNRADYPGALRQAEKYAAATKGTPTCAVAFQLSANMHRALGRYEVAERLYREALEIFEKVPDGYSNLSILLHSLGQNYEEQGYYGEAEKFFEQALRALAKDPTRTDEDVVGTLGPLARVYQAQGRYREAEKLFLQVLAVRRKAHGDDHSDVGAARSYLGNLYAAQRRFPEAEKFLKEALRNNEKLLPKDHPDIATMLAELADVLREQGKLNEAKPLLLRALSIRQATFGEAHPVVAKILDGLSLVHSDAGEAEVALLFSRRATGAIIAHTRTDRTLIGEKDVGAKLRQQTTYFQHHVRHLAAAGTNNRALAAEAFEMAQWGNQNSAAGALRQLGVRFGAGTGMLAVLVRELQDHAGVLLEKDKTLVALLAQPADGPARARIDELRRELSTFEKQIGEIKTRLTTDFPDYAALSDPKPLSVASVQAQLGADDALVSFFDTPEDLFVWAVTKADMNWVRVSLGSKALSETVAALRCGLDATLWNDDVADKCRGILQKEPHVELVGFTPVQVLPFDLTRAHELYKMVFDPIADLIKNRHVLMVPSGPLTSIPFHVLVTEAPTAAHLPALADYRSVRWFGTTQTSTVLPSVAALQSLRQQARVSRASKPYLGVGNPLLEGLQDDPREGAYYKQQAELARKKQSCASAVGRQAGTRARRAVTFGKVFRGGHVHIEHVRVWTPLPETADELCTIGQQLGTAESDILLGARATERTLKELSESGGLATYSIVHFATHGALGGQVEGSVEPGLILTPPSKGTSDPVQLARDDGFLTASEIAALKLDATWAILSACNTAGGDGQGAEALSGMARAFFYAGATALLVSHWEVGSDAAVKLTTRAFAELRTKPAMARAEALRNSMRDLIANGTDAEAHPSLWAPFVVVGEGAGSGSRVVP